MILNNNNEYSENSFIVVEAYKTLRTNILFALSITSSNVFAITSANPSEGKSVTAYNIAAAFADMNYRVILVDADLRRPIQHRKVNKSNVMGLSSILGKMCSIDDAVMRNEDCGYDLITSGPLPPNPSEMLAGANMEALVKYLSDKYDYVIIDTPPVNVVTDPLVISKYCAGMLLVAMENKTNYDEFSRAINNIEMVNGNILGVVYNGISQRTGKYYGKYKYKYAYY